MFGSEKGKEFNLQSPKDRVRDERNRIVFTLKKRNNHLKHLRKGTQNDVSFVIM